MSTQKSQRKPRGKHNAETIRLAKAIPFTAQELHANKKGKFAADQYKELSQHISKGFIINGLLLIVFTVLLILVLTGVLDLAAITFTTSARRIARMQYYAVVLLGGGAAFSAWRTFKGLWSIMEFRNGKILRYRGNVLFSQKQANNETQYFIHMGETKWRIDPKYYGIFKEGYEYTIYYLNNTEAILSAEATDSAFN